MGIVNAYGVLFVRLGHMKLWVCHHGNSLVTDFKCFSYCGASNKFTLRRKKAAICLELLL